MIIESHAHYSHKRFDGTFRYLTGELTAREGQREDLLDRLRESGVVLSIEPGIDFESNRRTAALYRQHPDFIRLAVGVHPTRTHQAPWRQRRQLEVWAREPGVAAIGETERRRKKQDAYNKAHGIVPQTIRKDVRKVLEISKDAQQEQQASRRKLTDAEREATIRRLEKEMKEASKMLEFEYAALLRDQIIALRGEK